MLGKNLVLKFEGVEDKGGGGGGEWTILGPKRAHTHNSGTFLKFCRVKGANRYMKTLLVAF